MSNAKSILDYNDYDKLEWVHSQLMELKDEPDNRHWDVDLMIEFIEDVREQYFDDANSVFVTLKEEWK